MFTAKEAREYLEQQNGYDCFIKGALTKIKDNIKDSKSNRTSIHFNDGNICFKDDLKSDLESLGYTVEFISKNVMKRAGYQESMRYFIITF